MGRHFHRPGRGSGGGADITRQSSVSGAERPQEPRPPGDVGLWDLARVRPARVNLVSLLQPVPNAVLQQTLRIGSPARADCRVLSQILMDADDLISVFVLIRYALTFGAERLTGLWERGMAIPEQNLRVFARFGTLQVAGIVENPAQCKGIDTLYAFVRVLGHVVRS